MIIVLGLVILVAALIVGGGRRTVRLARPRRPSELARP